MTLWNRADQANNAPKYKVMAGSNASGQAMFANVTVGAFIHNTAVGIFGVNANATHNSPHATHGGWIKVMQFTGPITNVTISTGGTGYSNTDTIRVSGGAVNATYSLSTNSTGGIANITQTATGSSFKSANTLVYTVLNANGTASVGTGATFSGTLGGRAGRVFMETLVAMGTISGNDAVFPTLG